MSLCVWKEDCVCLSVVEERKGICTCSVRALYIPSGCMIEGSILSFPTHRLVFRARPVRYGVLCYDTL